MAQHNKLGQKGEDKAASYLLDKGYRLAARNFRYDHKEVDIIAWDKEELVVVEVRTRDSAYHEHPRNSLTPAKIKAIAYAAEAYILQNELDCNTRFDLVCWIPHKDDNRWEIEHIEDAFHPLP
ncbi:YraN family protein [Marinilabilia sp.]|uniref:YraN family protein n=1 Tax=Marinilabilia sp. TaxID=2021252 RepID=UPI0025C0A4A8|nr:YraN family protein [Marinilabilia sp.]